MISDKIKTQMTIVFTPQFLRLKLGKKWLGCMKLEHLWKRHPTRKAPSNLEPRLKLANKSGSQITGLGSWATGYLRQSSFRFGAIHSEGI